MGCTTSASTVHTPDANATGKHITFTEEPKETSNVEQITTKVQDDQDVKVLPTCDTLVESIQLAKNNNNEKSYIDMSTIDIEKVCQSTENEIMEPDSITDDKITSLEKVVEKVIEIQSCDSNEKITRHDDVNNETDALIVDSRDNNYECSDSSDAKYNESDHISKPTEDEKIQDESKEEYFEEATSPSQSDSSRATRWEALADIAAELPPSLTVDPITGQIYSLAK